MKKTILIMMYLVNFYPVFADAPAVANKSDPKATKLVERAEQQSMGKSLSATMSMSIIRGTSSRDLKFKLWLSGRDKALVKVDEPLKDRDSGSLRLNMNLWQYLPNVGRVVRIPPSMMLQSWMGSDFTNDDLIKSSSLSRDYTHQLDGEETINGEKLTRLILLPKTDAPVVWGKIKLWLRPSDAITLRQEFYSEHGELLKVMEGTDVKKFGSHTLPATMTMTVVKKPGTKTIMSFNSATFDTPMKETIFTQQSLTQVVK
jgi:outer membrane lipoprotein-sorting protein